MRARTSANRSRDGSTRHFQPKKARRLFSTASDSLQTMAKILKIDSARLTSHYHIDWKRESEKPNARWSGAIRILCRGAVGSLTSTSFRFQSSQASFNHAFLYSGKLLIPPQMPQKTLFPVGRTGHSAANAAVRLARNSANENPCQLLLPCWLL